MKVIKMTNLDSLDLKILAAMAFNAKKPYTDIGKTLDVHPNVIGYRVSRMEKAGIIKRYVLEVDLEKMGFNEHMFVGANFPKNIPRNELIKEVSSMPQTLTILSTLGNPEMLIFLLGRNKSDIENTLSNLKSLNLDIQYSSPIVKTCGGEGLRSLLKTSTLNPGNSNENLKEDLPIIN
jgi:DNA-binding Lrp family transcriptional regulator